MTPRQDYEERDRVLRLIAALEWIRKRADANYEQDDELRAMGARTLKRIADKCDEALTRR